MRLIRSSPYAIVRSYYSGGEFVPGSPGQPYCHGPDQLGSVRRAFASASSALAYGYDQYAAGHRTVNRLWLCRDVPQRRQLTLFDAIPCLQPYHRTLAIARSDGEDGDIW